jgi:metal-responsive CopG/Arc/MetJ family transcriptional regulator
MEIIQKGGSKMPENMVRINVALPEWLLKKIDEVAKEMGLTRSVVIRLVLLAGLSEFDWAEWQRKRKEVTRDVSCVS